MNNETPRSSKLLFVAAKIKVKESITMATNHATNNLFLFAPFLSIKILGS